MRRAPNHLLKTARPSGSVKPLQKIHSRYLFFGGKGGVGKTTTAASTALFLLDAAEPGDSILLFSTDPAHSLSDSIGKTIGDRLVEIDRRNGAKLFAYEMDARIALERFRKAHAKVLGEIAERGTLLDESDIEELLNLSLPGLDEVMSLFELSELDREGTFKHIVVDTAPSGHTSRLLQLPGVFKRMANALDRMADKHRYMVAQFARRRVPADEVDLFLRDLDERIERVRAILYDKHETTFTLVTIPEPMSIRETERYLALLKQEGVPVTDLLINRVEEAHSGCAYCGERARSQQPLLQEIATTFAELRIRYVPLFPVEVRGREALREFAQRIWVQPFKPRKKISLRVKPRDLLPAPARADGFPLDSRRIVIFGGKGGVGKTTAAAAFSLALARKDPKRRMLVFSIDPAHSLSDSFAEPIGPLQKRLGAQQNLDGMEIDPAEWLAELKQRYRKWTDELFASLSGGSRLDIKFDREAMRELVELTPPGIDEIAALGTIADLLDEKRYDTIVLDTAPTGHLLRFLELPQIALAWVRTFIKLLLKYQHIVHAGRVAEELIAMSKSIKRVLAILTDAQLCEFVGVAIPERMSLEETADLVNSLKSLKVSMNRLLINGLIPEDVASACEFCRARRRGQRSTLRAFAKRFEARIRFFSAPQQPHDIHGQTELIRHFQTWQEMSAKDRAPRLTARLRMTGGQVKNRARRLR